MEDLQTFIRVGLALVVGLLIGWERGWHTRELSSGERAMGVRTFMLVSLLGAVSALLVEFVGELVLAVAFAGVLALTVSSYLAELKKPDPDRGLTTEIALLLTFALGAYVTVGNLVVGLATAVAVVAILQVKPELHRLVSEVNRLELNSAIRLLVISAIMLPLLPDRGYGPGEVINPFELWWMVVLISALSFVGYFAVKFAGPRAGMPLSGVLGGLASSTAVTMSLSRLTQRDKSLAPAAAIGIGLACAVMFLRVPIVAGLANIDLATRLAVPLAAMAVATFAVAAVLARSLPRASSDITQEISDPSDIPAALKFGALLLVLALAAHYLRERFGAEGMYAVSVIAGLADVDAITLTLARSAGDEQMRGSIVIAIALAVFTNTLVKMGIAAAIGGAGLAKGVWAMLGAALIVGALVVALV